VGQSRARSPPQQTQSEELFRKLVDVVPAAILADTDGDDNDDDGVAVDPVDNAVALGDGPDAAQAGELPRQSFPLLVRILRQPVDDGGYLSPDVALFSGL